MKSFKLDRESVSSWPAILIAFLLTGVFAYIGWNQPAWRSGLVIASALLLGVALRDWFAGAVQSQYPNAKHTWLVSVGMCSAIVGVGTRMVMPQVQGGLVDYAWLSVTFFAILGFVLVNRNDPDVVK